jgi:1-acyl-sn-glycerol-3-phosphate acyltransferase
MYWLAIKATFVPVEIVGEENLMRNQRAIYIANHQSALDIPVVGYLACCNPQVWFALEYYVDKPIVGFFIRNIGVAIDRDDPFKAARSLVKALKILEDKPYSFVIFPEGGRFNDGSVHEFLQGYVVVAKRTGLPIIPIYMPNNGVIYPPGSLVVYDHPLKIVVGKPFRYNQEETDDQFAQRVFAWYQEQQQNL